MNERQLAIFRLFLTEGVGAVTYKKFVRVFGSPEAALAAPRSRLAEIDGIGGKRASLISNARGESAGRVDEELALAEEHGARVITLEDEEYPRALRTIYDPPLVLYVKGGIEKRDGLALAIVGSRRAGLWRSSAWAMKPPRCCRGVSPHFSRVVRTALRSLLDRTTLRTRAEGVVRSTVHQHRREA